MDWLKSAAQAAFAKGNAIPGLTNFGLGDRQSEYDGLTLWTLYSGTKRDDASPVSVFVFDAAQPTSLRTDRKTLLQLARNALRKLKTLRHPDLIRYIDGSETDSAVYIVTEPVVPLSTRIGRDGEIKPTSASALDQGTGEEWRIWGLSKMVNALAFINDSVGATHGNLRLSSVFVAPGGDWRLGGFELLSSEKDPSPTLYVSCNPLSTYTHAQYTPSDPRGTCAPSQYVCATRSSHGRLHGSQRVSAANVSHLMRLTPLIHCSNDAHAYDSFLLYLFMHLLFNGPLPPSTTSETPTSRGNIPPSLFPHARRLYTPNGPPNSRMKASTLWAAATAQTPPGPFRANRLVRLADGLDGFALANEADKAALIRNIKECLPGENAKPASKLPAEFLKYKVLPSLVKSFELPQGATLLFCMDIHTEFACVAGPQLLPLIIALSAELKAEEYQKLVLPAIIKGFASPDRAMRMALLEGLPNYIEKLDKRVVVDKIWPSLLTGFSDVVPVIREATVKATLQFAPKVSFMINPDF